MRVGKKATRKVDWLEIVMVGLTVGTTVDKMVVETVEQWVVA